MIYRLIRYSHQRGHRCARSWTSARTSNRHAHDSFCPIWLPICFDPLAPPFAGNGDAKSTDRPVEDDGLGRMQIGQMMIDSYLALSGTVEKHESILGANQKIDTP